MLERKKEELYYGSGQPYGAIRARLLNRVLGLPVVGRVGVASRSVCVVLCALLRVLLCVPLCALMCVLLCALSCVLLCTLLCVPRCVLLCALLSVLLCVPGFAPSYVPPFPSGGSFCVEFPLASSVVVLLLYSSACLFGRRVVLSRSRSSSSLFVVCAVSVPGCQAAESHRGGPSVS